MQISADLGNSVCAQFEADGVVCPPKLKKSVFTTGSVSNIDHNQVHVQLKTYFTEQRFLSPSTLPMTLTA